MAEYIEREAIQKRLNRIVEVNNLRTDLAWFTPYGVKALIEEFPAADVRPVVLCRDCKCYQQSHYIDNHMECARSGVPVHSVDFCSFGEKREES